MNAVNLGIRRTSLVCATAFSLTFASIAGAQTGGPLSSAMTFSEPVQIPGATIPAGTYVLEYVAGAGAQGSVIVSTRQPKQVVARLRIVPTTRASNGNAVTFRSTPSGAPAAIAAWYLNGGKEGYEFLYSVEEVRNLARRPALADASLAK